MERLGAGEVATLVIGLFAAFALLQARRERPDILSPAFLAGVGLTLAAYVFTLVEDFVAHDAINVLEHFALLAAALAFLAAAARRDGTG